MVRRFAALFTGIWLLAAPLSAQRVEVSFSGGYTASEGVAVEERVVLGAIYNQVDVTSGGSYHFTFGVFASPNAQVEFLYGRQMSTLQASGPAISTKVADMNVSNYHGNFVYNWGESDAKVRPFAFVGLGATSYSSSDYTSINGQNTNFSDTQFSTTWGGGVKMYLSPNFGIKATARWTPTYIKSTSAGYWCDPWYGCWLLADPDYSHQFDISGGVTIRF